MTPKNMTPKNLTPKYYTEKFDIKKHMTEKYDKKFIHLKLLHKMDLMWLISPHDPPRPDPKATLRTRLDPRTSKGLRKK